MRLARISSRAQEGIKATAVTVEVHISNGLPSLSIVGLAETTVKESKDRVRAALLSSQFDFPQQRITINLAPADLPKDGGRFDLAIAIGILLASGQIEADTESYEFIGELTLGGEIRAVPSILPVSMACQQSNKQLICPQANADEATLCSDTTVLPARHILDVCAHLQGHTLLSAWRSTRASQALNSIHDMADVNGQSHAKRALEIAASGEHSLLMSGPPGTGKTMLASRLPSILPRMSEAEALETASITSITAQGIQSQHWRQRPFRAPHHTASAVALVGGGSTPRPGEISLAHHGVLFLDELPEFNRKVLEVLREPMESGRILISRAARQAEFPARFQLIAAMNPCPCGYLGDTERPCHCSAEQISRYRQKISGPMLDRIDMHIEVPRLSISEAGLPCQDNESSTQIRQRVEQTRQRQQQRQQCSNANMGRQHIHRFCSLTESDHLLLESAMQQFGLSMRAYNKILKLSRTIADMDASADIQTRHLSEALSYRQLDRNPHGTN